VANHTSLLFRISGTGLGQSEATEFNVPSIRKSPFGSSGTVKFVLCSTNGAAAVVRRRVDSRNLWFQGDLTGTLVLRDVRRHHPDGGD